MTELNSICIKCAHLITYNNLCQSTKEKQGLIGGCYLTCCGVNAGNRKTCKHFVEADKETINCRSKALQDYIVLKKEEEEENAED